MPPSNSTPSSYPQSKSIKTDSDDRILTQKDSSTEQTTSRSSFEQRPYYHDVLVIQTQPPTVIKYVLIHWKIDCFLSLLNSLNLSQLYSIHHKQLLKLHRFSRHPCQQQQNVHQRCQQNHHHNWLLRHSFRPLILLKQQRRKVIRN